MFDALVRQDGATVHIDLVGNGHVVTQNSDVLQTSPLAHRTVPADDGRLHPRVVLDLAVLQKDTALQANAIADNDIGTNNDVRADAAVLADLCAGVDHDIPTIHVGLAVGGEQFGVALRERGKVQTGTAQEILRLTDVHPEAFQVKRMELTFLANGRECLLFDRGGTQFDAVQHAGVEDIDTGVDTVADELDGLFDETVDARSMVGFVNDDAVFGRLINLRDDDSTFVTVVLVEIGQFFEGVIANNVGVQDEEGGVVLAQDTLRQLQGTGRAQRFGLDRELDADIVLFLVLAQI